MKLKVGDLVRFKDGYTTPNGPPAVSVGIVVGFPKPASRTLSKVDRVIDVVLTNGERHRTWTYLVQKVCND